MRSQRMRSGSINKNPELVKRWLDNEKKASKQYYNENPDSLIPQFEKELRDLGFKFDTSSQTFAFIPKHKKEILPIALKYYQRSKNLSKSNEQNHFMRFFNIKGLDEVVPMLLEDFYSEKTEDLTRWFISNSLFEIQSKRYIKEYLDIVSSKRFGINRQMIVLLLGKLKEESAVPVLIGLLDDEDVQLQAICELSKFEREDFRGYFNKFQNSLHPGIRKYAKMAINKLDNIASNCS